jgi:hypothetical protein
MKRATFLVLFSALTRALPASEAAQKVAENKLPANHARKSEDSFLSGAPFTYDQVLKLVGESPIPLRRRKDAIQNRGVDFSLTSEQIDKLKAAGATDDMLELIKTKAKPAPAAAAVRVAPKPPATGGMSLACEPAECEVSLDGKSIGPTLGGKLEVAKLTPRQWIVDFKKDGYIGRQYTVAVEADKTAPVSAALEANGATQEAFGAALFKKVIEAVGGETGVQALGSVQAIGSTTVWGRDGSSVRWTLLLRNRPDRSLFQARAGAGILHEVAFIGSQYNTSKNLKGQEALDLPTHFGFIRDAMLAAVISRLQNPEFKMTAKSMLPAAGEEYSLFAERGTEKIAVGLDSQLRPERVRITTATGVGSATITYADYFRGDKAFWPKTLQIKPDSWQHGIEVRFDSVELSPRFFTDNDFKMKGKPLVPIGN